MNRAVIAWLPVAVLGMGTVLTLGIQTQHSVPLASPLGTTIPQQLLGLDGADLQISEAEQAVAGMNDYLMRIYGSPESDAAGPAFSLYVGYYESQTQGNTIHSPKNCLPGAGWEALTSRRETIHVGNRPIAVNRYLIQNGDERALVLYWYQGRGHVEANEYVVKWKLLRDAALRGRSEEALVRIIVPVTTSEDAAYAIASRAAVDVIPAVADALPT